MYRTYLPNSLPCNELKSRNKYAPNGVKYCNGLCQDFRNINEFSGTGSNIKMICNKCRSLINLAEKQIKQNIITLEQFKENPEIVNGIDLVITSEQTCNICKELKPITSFDCNKKQCKACRAILATERNSEIETYLTDIDNNKNNLEIIKRLVSSTPKDKLIKIISHYKIGRKSSDTKARMEHNTIEHFRSLLNPNLCMGGCGFTILTQFTTCLNCQQKEERKQNSNQIPQISFEDNLENIIENLQLFDHASEHLYNKEQTFKIARKLGISVKQKDPKSTMITAINTFLEQDKKEKDELINSIGVEESKHQENTEIELNGIIVLSRDDGFINATQLCKAGNKKFNDWKRLDSTSSLIQALESDTGLTVSQIIDIKKGNSSKFSQGSWIHPDLAVQLAQWISPRFALQVSRWVRELAVTGSVSIGIEKTNEQLLELHQRYKEEQGKNKNLERKHTQLLLRRSYYKFKKGPAFYIISDIDSSTMRYKVGIDHVDINVRLAQHRTSIPALKLDYLLYTNKNNLIESIMLERYKNKRKPYQNHEWIYEVELTHIIDSIQTVINFMDIEFTQETELEEYNE